MPVEAGLQMSPSDLSSGYLTVRGLLRLHSNLSCCRGRGTVASGQHGDARWTTPSAGGTARRDAGRPYLAVFEGHPGRAVVQEPRAGGQVFMGATRCRGRRRSVVIQVALALLLSRWTLVPQRRAAKSKRDEQTPP